MHSVISSHSLPPRTLSGEQAAGPSEEGRKQDAVGAEEDGGREEARNQSGEGHRGARKTHLRCPPTCSCTRTCMCLHTHTCVQNTPRVYSYDVDISICTHAVCPHTYVCTHMRATHVCTCTHVRAHVSNAHDASTPHTSVHRDTCENVHSHLHTHIPLPPAGLPMASHTLPRSLTDDLRPRTTLVSRSYLHLRCPFVLHQPQAQPCDLHNVE